MREKDELDLLLDAALSTYADPGPHSGLEERVAAALRGERGRPIASAPRRGRWWVWAVGIPIAASLLLWIAAGKIKHTTPIRPELAYESQPTQATLEGRPIAAGPGARAPHSMRPSGAKAPSDSAAIAARLKSCPVTKLRAGEAFSERLDSCPSIESNLSSASNSGNITALPKLDVFPTPQPLTQEEHALAVVATQTPAPVRNALLAAQTQDDAPVRIAAIHVPPIEPPDEGQP